MINVKLYTCRRLTCIYVDREKISAIALIDFCIGKLEVGDVYLLMYTCVYLDGGGLASSVGSQQAKALLPVDAQ